MGAIPTQRETVSCVSGTPAHPSHAPARECVRAHAVLPGSSLAPGGARALVRAALADWSGRGLPGTGYLTDRLADDALVAVSELVTNAVVHAGTDVEVVCRLEETGALVLEVSDHHPSRAPRGAEAETPYDIPEYGRGLRLVATLSEAWGITYRTGTKTVWARLPAEGEAVAEQIETYAEERALDRELRVAEILAPQPPAAGGNGQGTRGRADRQDTRAGTGGRRGRRRPGGREAASQTSATTPEARAGAPDGPPAADAPPTADAPAAAVARPDGSPGSAAGVARADGSPGSAAGVARADGSPGSAAGVARADGSPGSAAGVARADGSPGSAAGVARADGSPGSAAAAARPEGSPAATRPSGPETRPDGLPVPKGHPHATAVPERPAVPEGPAALDPPVAPDNRPGTPAAPDERDGPHAPDRQDRPDWADWRDGTAGPHWRGVRDREWLGRGALSFLAEASDLLAGQLDEDLVASLTGQLIVPRLADWCAVWLEDESLGRGAWSDDPGAAVGSRLARVWHGSESCIEELRCELEKNPPRPRDPWSSGPVEHPWPGEALGPRGAHGSALAYRLVAGGRPLGSLVIGRAGTPCFPDEITGLVEDLSRRVALAIGAARQYARQATISAVLQRGLLPGAVAEIPGVRSALVYEPCDKGGPSGDFYDLFPAGDGRWCFAVGDVQGKGPEAAVVIGLARPWLRLLAREQYGVPDVLDRLNQLLLDDATEAADAAARALVAVGGPPVAPGDGPQTRFLSLLYGELEPFDGGVRCTLASAGHPLPLLLGPDGTVRAVAQPQTLLGVVEDATYISETFEMRPGDTLLCVTDGVTERRSGSRQFDDGDGLAAALAGCAGLDAELIAERIRRLVHEFAARPPEDDLALLVLQAE
ncbi:SpoIIE family protein phosphatase [Streptomyces sp. NPDC052309]|uniref:SpoIIE family protein phosphatase n=1 Tax=Streptomyces sp. NPDC052309 TaxID=3155421 RepID=UPI00343DF28C